jgi:hypothetical protein
MERPYFELQSPIKPEQARIARHISMVVSNYYPGIPIRQLFGVPIAQIVKKDEQEIWRSEQKLGRVFGRIPVLIVDQLTYEPVCAVLMETRIDRRVMESVRVILDEMRLPWVQVTAKNLETSVERLLCSALSEKRHHDGIRPVHDSEWTMAKKVRYWMRGLQKHYQIMEQIGLSEAVETMMLDQLKSFHAESRWKRPTSVSEFNAATPQHQYWALNQFAARGSLDLLLLSHTQVYGEQTWWPVLAIEFDGPQHKTDPKQRFRDFQKDRICLEADLPILRVSFPDAGVNIASLAGMEGSSHVPDVREVYDDFILYMIGIGLRHGSFVEQRRRQDARRRTLAIAKRIKVLTKQGRDASTAIEQAFEEYDEALSQTWLEDGANAWAGEEIHKLDLKEYHSSYQAQYGVPPKVEIYFDKNGAIKGRLGKFFLPRVQVFCNLIGHEEMRMHMEDFATAWLLRRATTTAQMD